MAIRLSLVTVSGGTDKTEFLVGSIPRNADDLAGWTAFEDFTEQIKDKSEISVHVKAYLYGEGEGFNATPEEIAYFMQRIEMRPDFLSSRCKNLESFEFAFAWEPAKRLGLEMA